MPIIPFHIANIVFTTDLTTNEDDCHGVVLAGGTVATKKGMREAGQPTHENKIPANVRDQGISRCEMFQVVKDSPKARVKVRELIDLHRKRYGHAAVHTAGTGPIARWIQDGAIIGSDAPGDDKETDIVDSGIIVNQSVQSGTDSLDDINPVDGNEPQKADAPDVVSDEDSSDSGHNEPIADRIAAAKARGKKNNK
tara:strand:- start:757 stop:1344 length:588 start_codon:yes stop_codon:yes gene_type:complete